MTMTFTKAAFVAAFIAGAGFAGAALAQSSPPSAAPEAQAAPQTPATPGPQAAAPLSDNDCLRAAMDLAQSAEDKNLAEETLEKIDDLLLRMETHCDAKQFTEAAAVATDIKSMIEKH